MPTFCPHCHKMVAERPTCANCGKRLLAASPDGALDRQTMAILLREVFGWVLGIVGVGFLCVFALYFLLS